MIYTVTFNPSLDYIVDVSDFRMGLTNRCNAEQMVAGGKGINVSLLLKNLGLESTALGFTAGFTGEEIRRQLEKKGICADFIRLESGISRVNVKIKTIEGTEINGEGPTINEGALAKLFARLEHLKAGDILVLAGSIPGSVPETVYSDILERLADRGILTAVDATGSLLLNVLCYHPFLIKPNNHELGELFGVEIRERNQVEPYARKLQEKGARNVLVSMAGKGAVLLSEEGKIYQSPAPKGTLVNGVGAGDSMVAGFLAGFLEKADYEYAFKMGVAAGSASAFSENLATQEEVEAVYSRL